VGIKLMTCFMHAINGKPIEIREHGQRRLAKVFIEKEQEASFYVRFLDEDGNLLLEKYPVRFDQERQGYVDIEGERITVVGELD